MPIVTRKFCFTGPGEVALIVEPSHIQHRSIVVLVVRLDANDVVLLPDPQLEELDANLVWGFLAEVTLAGTGVQFPAQEVTPGRKHSVVLAPSGGSLVQ